MVLQHCLNVVRYLIARRTVVTPHHRLWVLGQGCRQEGLHCLKNEVGSDCGLVIVSCTRHTNLLTSKVERFVGFLSKFNLVLISCILQLPFARKLKKLLLAHVKFKHVQLLSFHTFAIKGLALSADFVHSAFNQITNPAYGECERIRFLVYCHMIMSLTL